MIVVAVTGLIGSGKSTVAGAIAQRVSGCLFDCDKVCEEIIREDDFGCVFGFSLDIPDLMEKKRFISDYIFGNPVKRTAYEGHMWRKCAERFDDVLKAEQNKGRKILVLDAPLLFQSGFDARADKVVLVEAGRDVRRARFIARGGERHDFDVRDELQSDYFSKNSEHVRSKIWRIVRNDRDVPVELGFDLGAELLS